MAESASWHVFKNLSLLLLSLIALPFTTLALLITICLPSFHHGPRSNATNPKRILVTGISMSKGLAIARLLYRQGHVVIGADCHRFCAGRVSRAIRRFHLLPTCVQQSVRADGTGQDPYTSRLLQIVVSERIDLWISASDVKGAVRDGLARDLVEQFTPAKAIQLGQDDVATLDDKSTFMEYVRSLGLTIPDTHYVGSRAELEAFLVDRDGLSLRPGGKQYIVKPVGVNDVARFGMPLLPCPTEQQTMAGIGTVDFDSGAPFIVQEYIQGEEYCTHALVIRGEVRAFVACPSSELLMHYTALPGHSPLSESMLDFTRKVIGAQGNNRWTGHVSFDFLVPHTHDEEAPGAPDVYPIECNPRVHTAVLLFNQTPELVEEYLSALQPVPGHRDRPLYPVQPQRTYWAGQDLVEKVLYPAFETIFLRTRSLHSLAKSVAEFGQHVFYWKDGVFEIWDPFPFWWLHHVQWPLLFTQYLFKGRWHRVNVSTGKVFGAS